MISKHFQKIPNISDWVVSMDEFLPVSQKFYDSIKDSLTTPNLIVDLRNNGGGAFKNSEKFLKLITKYASKGKVYTLVNGRTVSNAEQFTLKLKKLKNHTLLGTRTCGMLTYGSNYGQRYDLPSKRYEFAITDMKGDLEELKYEDEGIEPDVYLKTDTDFVEQVLALIRSK
jgi:C-terminal processing protease CtpA/Prc